jgi:hypothetical protein
VKIVADSSQYLFYMLYFDRLRAHDFGKVIRRQLWAGLHFPLHITLVLALEGTRQLVVWGQALRYFNFLFESIIEMLNQPDATAQFPYANVTDAIANFGWDQVFYYSDKNGDSVGKAADGFYYAIGNLSEVTAVDDSNASLYAGQAAVALADASFTGLGIKLPKKKGDKSDGGYDAVKQLSGYVSLLTFIFTYFFVVTGLTILFCVLISCIARPPKTVGAWLRNGATSLIGVAICLLALLGLSDSEGVANYLSGPWPLPTIVIALFIGKFDPVLALILMQTLTSSSCGGPSHSPPLGHC